jgi:hypothetical protein
MNYAIFQLTDFDIKRLEVVKETVMWLDGQDHSRWVLKTPSKIAVLGHQELYLKIWNPTYIRRDNILAGIDVGFYDEKITPALVGLIFHKGICRGYAVKMCTRNWGRKLDNHFYDLIKEKSEITGYFSYQFSRYHIMRYKKCLNLIDLEGIYPIENLHSLTKYRSRFDDKKYETFITGLYNERFARPFEQSPIQPVLNEQVGGRSHLLKRVRSFLWKLPISFLKEAIKARPNHTYLIEE